MILLTPKKVKKGSLNKLSSVIERPMNYHQKEVDNYFEAFENVFKKYGYDIPEMFQK